MIPAAWRTPLLAALAVEAAAGLPAAAATLRANPGDGAMTLFAACTVAAGEAGMVLVPGWVWAPRASLTNLVVRCILLVLTIPLAVFAGFMVAFFGIASTLAAIPGLAAAGVLLCFAAAGAVVGLGASLADSADGWSGAMHGRTSSHVLAGAFGCLAVLGAAALVAWRTGWQGDGVPRLLPGPFAALAPVALAMAGGLHHLLLARIDWRAGVPVPHARTVTLRASAACAACAVVAAAVLALA